jgi:uncharacterized membrane protein
MPELLATLLWLYLFCALLPVIVAWRCELPAHDIRCAFVYGVLLGWTMIGYVVAWLIATDDTTPSLRVTQWIEAADGMRGMGVTVDLSFDAYGRQV